MAQNPFGDDSLSRPRRTNPFGEDDGSTSIAEAAEKMDGAARKIRTLRTQIGSEGLTLPATRELIDQVATAIEAAAAALRGIGGRS
ncbi:MAG TPA: hypothetical protein VFQ38_00710 [Longimicrobiales bacterium]|nr:hypothetical protein [Longimicrobiales bacterium]